MKRIYPVIFTLITLTSLAQEPSAPSALQLLEPFVGIWHAPDSVVAKNPPMQGKAIFKFEFDDKKTHMNLYEGVSLSDTEDYGFKGLLVTNPVSNEFEFLGVNRERNFLFKGVFKDVTDKGFTREYQVFYPAESQMAKMFGQVIKFREVFKLQDKDTMSFGILYFNEKNKQWEKWSPQDHVVIRKS